jgi:Fur family transcriptional regulator, ferric uptake regulator
MFSRLNHLSPKEFRMAPQRRETRQRVAVAAALDDVESFVSAQQLHTRLREAGDGVGLATVYRTLQQLAEDGEVDVLRASDTESMYRRCSSGHHHHLVCRSCRRTVEVDSVAVERWARRIADDNGFIDVAHVVEVFGTCADCAATQIASVPQPGR